jgi:hypothetical protein
VEDAKVSAMWDNVDILQDRMDVMGFIMEKAWIGRKPLGNQSSECI